MASKQPLPMPPRAELYHKYVIKQMTNAQLAQFYHVGTGTISKWMKLLEIEARGKAVSKIIGGKVHRQCFGPLHQGKFVSITKFHKNRSKTLGTKARCTECENVSQRVPFTPQIQAWVKSIVYRLGQAESARRLEICEKTLRTWLGKENGHEKPSAIKRTNAIRIVKLMGELRLTGEVRHRHSIRRGSTARGEVEKVPTRTKDFLGPAEILAEARQRNRKQNIEREREYSRNYKRKKKAEKQASLTSSEAA